MCVYPKPVEVYINKKKPPLKSGPLLTKLEECTSKIVVIQGGGDAAKTVTVLQWLAIKAIQGADLQISVVGLNVPNLKRGAMRAFRRYIAKDPQIKPYIKSFNSTDREYHFTTGSIIQFVSFQEDEDARGSENDYVYMNEANLMSYTLFWELQRKCRYKVLLDFNPTFAFWAHAKLLNKKGDQFDHQFDGKVQRYIVDHRHNPFLSEEKHQEYESISDPERFKVYARGMTGRTTGCIFNWTKVDKIPEGLPFGFGIDIGYTTDKTAIAKVYMDSKKHYYQELLYMSNDEIQDYINKHQLTNADKSPMQVEQYIAKILFENGCKSDTMVWGDHDKSFSAKLRRAGIPYRMAKKGGNSEVASIGSVKRYECHYYQSPNIENETITYVWETAVDILTGNEITTGVPIAGKPDHLIAAIRYFEHSMTARFSG